MLRWRLWGRYCDRVMIVSSEALRHHSNFWWMILNFNDGVHAWLKYPIMLVRENRSLTSCNGFCLITGLICISFLHFLAGFLELNGKPAMLG